MRPADLAPDLGLSHRDRVALGLGSAILALRGLTLHLSGFGFYHGWNEARYSLVGLSPNSPLLVPWVRGELFYHTTPLPSYVIGAAYRLLWVTEWVARLPSLILAVPTLLAVFLAARKLYDARAGRAAGLLFAAAPWTLLWFGRAQNDAYYVALSFVALAALLHHEDRRWALPLGGIALGLAGFSKQPAILVFPVAAGWLAVQEAALRDRLRTFGRLVAWTTVGAIPLLAWMGYNLWVQPEALLADYLHETGKPLFGNVRRNLTIGLVGGAGPGILALAAYQALRETDLRRNPMVWWLLVFGAFVTLRTPILHEYYTLVLIPALAVLAGAGLWRLADDLQPRLDAQLSRPSLPTPRLARVGLALALVASLAAAVVLLGGTGDLGWEGEARAGALVEERAAETDRLGVYTPTFTGHILHFYAPSVREPDPAVDLVGYNGTPDPAEADALAANTTETLAIVEGSGDPPEAFRNRTVLLTEDLDVPWNQRKLQVLRWG